ncbi:MAG: hypothetical protein MK132_22365 [Lentisphaerales bacterium]|nr:hypothetical protein [Lentisphaerales bacterium]
MLANLKKDFEKVILAVLLILLAVSTIVALKSVDSTPLNVDGGTQGTEIEDVPDILDYTETLKEYAGILTPHDIVYCRNKQCNNLISKKFTSCSLCSTAIYKNEIVESDANDNFIPDEIELSWGGKLLDPKNHTRDLDGDGFRNIDEFRYNESPHDPESHPLYIHLTHFAGIEKRYLPIIFNEIEELKGKGGIKYYASGIYAGKGGFYRSVGESVYGIQILSINSKESLVSILYNKEKIDLPLKKRVMIPGWPKYKLKFMGSEKKLMVGQKFKLRNESYTFVSVAEDALIISSGRTKEEIGVGRIPRLSTPEE